MMTKHLYIAPIIFLLLSCSNKNESNETERKALLETDKEWSKSVASGDMERVFSYWTEDAIIYPVGMPPAEGKAAIRKFVAVNRSQKNFSLITNPLEATVSKSGDIGYTVGTYQVSMVGPDSIPVIHNGRYMCAWRKVDGSWKCNVEIHSPSEMPPDIRANIQNEQ
jgi:ketosteroid isomerase-like protein